VFSRVLKARPRCVVRLLLLLERGYDPVVISHKHLIAMVAESLSLPLMFTKLTLLLVPHTGIPVTPVVDYYLRIIAGICYSYSRSYAAGPLLSLFISTASAYRYQSYCHSLWLLLPTPYSSLATSVTPRYTCRLGCQWVHFDILLIIKCTIFKKSTRIASIRKLKSL